MRQDRLFPEGTIPEYTQAEWYAGRETAPHVDQDAHRPRLDKAAQYVRKIYQPGDTVSDLGAGDGGLLALISDVVPAAAKWGYDLVPTSDEAGARRGQDVRHADILTDVISFGTIAIATEMLEHLVDPHGYVADLATKVDYLIASSPWNESLEGHYEFHAWAWDVEGYIAMLSDNGWTVLEHTTVGVFTVALCRSSVRFP